MISNHLTDEEATAYHEAGHAVVGALRNRPPDWVTIIADGGAAGKTEFPDDVRSEFKGYSGDWPEKRAYIETRILIAVAGTIAHDLRVPDRAQDAGDAYDKQRARDFIQDHACWAESDREQYLQQLQESARGLLETNWP
jgi:ATP-dependent Zn protease